jgi:hypothetical protein
MGVLKPESPLPADLERWTQDRFGGATWTLLKDAGSGLPARSTCP